MPSHRCATCRHTEVNIRSRTQLRGTHSQVDFAVNRDSPSAMAMRHVYGSLLTIAAFYCPKPTQVAHCGRARLTASILRKGVSELVKTSASDLGKVCFGCGTRTWGKSVLEQNVSAIENCSRTFQGSKFKVMFACTVPSTVAVPEN